MMVSTTTKSLLLFSFVITAATSSSSSSSAVRNRRLLHQPFFPLSTAAPPTLHPPSLPPQPQTQPKYQFSTTPKAQQKPFFPYFPSLPPPTPPPPPPSASSLATFPANISSLLFPHLPPSSISRRHHHLITTVFISLSILFATILAALSGFFLYSRRRRGHHHHTATISEKTSSRSDSLRLFPPNAISSDGSPKPPKLPHHPGVSNTSSEFLYLGTLANSRNGLEDHQKATNSSNAGITIGVSSPAYQKLGSPELKPLPPLPRHNYTPSYRSGEALLGSSKEGEADTETDDDEGEQFFSPRGSSGQKECLQESQLPIGSSSRRELQGLQGENFGSTSFNSRTASYPYSNSVSRANSVSTSPSAVSSSSRISPKSKSQNSTQFIAGILGQNEQSPTRFESVVGVTNPFVQMGLCPPPPRPPPLPRFWDISSGVARDLNWMSSGPPMLVRPSKRVLVHNGESSLTCDQLHPNSSVERSEEAPKPKLKPLHWDKVVGSSDRGMVWDQLKSSSFQ